jgi:hypothetical protein
MRAGYHRLRFLPEERNPGERRRAAWDCPRLTELELLRGSLPAPPGFVLTTAAYRHFSYFQSPRPPGSELAH